jgi:hypothetical protein
MKGVKFQMIESHHQHWVGQPVVVFGPRNNQFHSSSEIDSQRLPRYFSALATKKYY